ncbi:MAG TPA: M20/M25/M40 family metallo-hydrolase [Myxococcaceae bacterium]|nr:M20/M25/M40 family metallo-hydrolase [Myxococcaceae bacterium]
MRLLPLLPCCLSLACATSAPRPTTPAVDANGFTDGAKSAAAGIRPEALAGHIRFLADDLLGGRDPGTPGYDVAARYVASELQALGLQPAGEAGSYFQKVPFVRATPVSGSLQFSGGPGTPATLVKGENLLLLTDLDQGVTDVSGEVVFAGYALSVPEYGYDDFAQVEVRDKIVLALFGAPRSERPDFFPSLASAVHGQSERVARELMRRGARAVVWVWPPAKEAITPFTLLAEYFAFDSMRLEDSPPLLPAGTISSAAFEALLKQAGRPETVAGLVEASAQGKPRGFSLGLRGRLRRESRIRHITSENVVGLLPGDPASPTAGEVVVYGAHLDHMGIGKPVNGDRIYNGASDDAAGVGSLLETARAFTRLGQPPRRGILFLFVTAEERGLLGSEWFARHPTVPLKDIVADIDVDGAYPVHPLKDVVALGTDESSLGANVARAADALGLQISPDPEPEESYFIRSDNFNFVKKGIPAAQTFNGVAGLTPDQRAAEKDFWRKRYHQPQDGFEPDRDWGPFAQLTRFNFLLGVSIAQAPARPTWNANSWFRRFPEPKRAGEPD